MEPSNQKRTESASFARPAADANNDKPESGEKLNSGYFSPEFLMNADVLDIVFEGRNKEYGAYELRKTYNRRLTKAIVIMSSVLLLGVVSCSLMFRNKGEKANLLAGPEVTISAVAEPPAPPVPPPPPPPKPQVQIAMRQFTVPKIVKEVREDEKPPAQEELEDVKIGAVNQEGVKDDGIVGPPALVSDGKGLVEAPKKEDDGPIFVPVESEAQFPGGMAAWIRFLQKTMRYPDEAVNIEREGKVVVQFVVDKEGNVSEVQAVSGPTDGGLREEAVRVIKKSGKWVPGNQNGRMVKSYKQQPVVFQLAHE